MRASGEKTRRGQRLPWADDTPLDETDYLLRSPLNAARLLESIAELDQGRATAPGGKAEPMLPELA